MNKVLKFPTHKPLGLLLKKSPVSRTVRPIYTKPMPRSVGGIFIAGINCEINADRKS